MLGSTFRNIRFALLKDIQKELAKCHDSNKIQTLVAYHNAVLNSSKLPSYIDYVMRAGLTIYMGILTHKLGIL
jgi:hypothetical protein